VQERLTIAGRLPVLRMAIGSHLEVKIIENAKDQGHQTDYSKMDNVPFLVKFTRRPLSGQRLQFPQPLSILLHSYRSSPTMNFCVHVSYRCPAWLYN